MDMSRTLLWLALITALYSIACLLIYRTTPLGQVALLDAREEQVLAKQMAEGALPATPYYRAPVWAGILSLYYRAGLNDDGVLLAGQLTNVALHLLATVFLYCACLQLWNKRLGALLAAGLYGLYPVAVYFTGDLLDTTLAQTLTCAALYFLIRAIHPNERKKTLAGFLAGALFAIGILARPQLLAAGLGAGLVLSAGIFFEQRFVRVALGVWLGLFLLLGGFGASEYLRTGDFYFLPAQASYNLWAANRPGATGEYYAQQMEMPDLPEGENPAHSEGRALYLQETGDQYPSEAKVNAYWRDKFLAALKNNPAGFLELYCKKLFGFLSNHESYNNKTYAFQKDQNPLLKCNPLGFVLLSLLALFTRLFYHKRPASAWLVTLTASLYWLGASLFYTSDRFRLPLVPFILILAAGAPSAFLQLRARWGKGQLKKIVLYPKLAFLAAWAVVFTLPPPKSQDTTAADKILMAQAALKVGDDLQAEMISSQLVSGPHPTLSAALCLMQSRYNLLLKGQETPSVAWCRRELSLARHFKIPTDEVVYLRGVCEWRLFGNRSAWRFLAAKEDSPERQKAIAALMMTGRMTPNELKSARMDSIPVLVSLACLGNSAAASQIQNQMGKAEAQNTLRAWQNLFDRPADKALNTKHAP